MQGLVEISQIGGYRVFLAKLTTVPEQRLEYVNVVKLKSYLVF
jgi:uncharacterized membrane protein YqhA